MMQSKNKNCAYYALLYRSQ